MTRQKIPVIIDTDPGVDDIIAILLALASPELSILALLVSYGNTDRDASYLNVLRLYQTLYRHFDDNPDDRDRFPNFYSPDKPLLIKGSHKPLEGDLHTAQYFHGRDGLGEISQRHPELNLPFEAQFKDHPHLILTDKPGIDVALELFRAYPSRSITYIVLGPLTNLARLVQKDGNLIRDTIGRVICMGGALDVPGNTSPVAEFNFFADPFAVKNLVLSPETHLGLPLDRFLLLPLDITTLHELPFHKYKVDIDRDFDSVSIPSRSAGKRPLVHFTSSFLERVREIMLQFGKDAMELHDVVAVWCAIENPPGLDLSPGWAARKRIFDIERTGELTRGMLVVDRRFDESAYSPGSNRAAVQAEVDKRRLKHHNWESTAVPAQIATDGLVPQTVTPGVFCVDETPGPNALLQLLFRRVWGVNMSDH